MKTVEEAADDFSGYGYGLCGGIEEAYIQGFEGFKAGVEFAQRWIPVEEELPEINWLKCLVKYSDESIGISPFQIGAGFVNFKSDLSTITHWRPIELK